MVPNWLLDREIICLFEISWGIEEKDEVFNSALCIVFVNVSFLGRATSAQTIFVNDKPINDRKETCFIQFFIFDPYSSETLS